MRSTHEELSRVVIADEVAFAPPAHRKVLMLNANGILGTVAERIVGKVSMAVNAHF